MNKAPTSRVMVYKPDHPRADRQGKVPRSWLVMEKIIGRAVAKGEIVHHINEDPRDDSPSNLQLFPSKAEHWLHHFNLRKAKESPEQRSERAKKSWSDMSPEQRVARSALSSERIRKYASKPGEDNGAHRLTEQSVKEIRDSRGKITRRALAAKYGVNKSTIDRVLDGKAWNHV